VKTNPFYDVFFTVLMCCICAGLLTFANVQWYELIKDNENFVRKASIVDALGLLSAAEPSRKDITRAFDESVRKKVSGEMTMLEGVMEDEKAGYALDVETQGKYGPIKAVLAIAPSKTSIKAFRVYDQNETPGLGGRIGERTWQDQFVGIPLKTGEYIGVEFGKKGSAPNEVDAITGASKTMFSLKKAINGVIAQFLSGGLKLEEINFQLDAVTKGTPGYPKTFTKPPHLREEVKRAPFLSVPGVELLSLKKPATCSVDMGPIIGELEQLTDGVKTCTEFDYVELDPGPQWVQVDIEEVVNIHCIAFWHYYKNPVVYKDVIVQVADDPEFTQNVRTVFNNDHDDSSKQGKGEDTAFFGRWWGEVVDTRGPDYEGIAARCVRIWTNGGEADEPTKFVEVNIYGTPPKTVVAEK